MDQIITFQNFRISTNWCNAADGVVLGVSALPLIANAKAIFKQMHDKF